MMRITAELTATGMFAVAPRAGVTTAVGVHTSVLG